MTRPIAILLTFAAVLLLAPGDARELEEEEFMTIPDYIPDDFREVGFNVPWIEPPGEQHPGFHLRGGGPEQRGR